jgi:hypothetical protein
VEVWDPNDKPTVFRRIKKLSQAYTGPLRSSRYLLYPGILFILVLLIFSLLPGCATMEWPWKKNVEPEKKEFICTKIDCGDENIEQLVKDEQNIIACIKLQPECKLDEEN